MPDKVVIGANGSYFWIGLNEEFNLTQVDNAYKYWICKKMPYGPTSFNKENVHYKLLEKDNCSEEKFICL